MTTSSRFWKIWQVDPAGEKLGYKQVLVPEAREFIENQTFNLGDNTDIQNNLLLYFNADKNQVDKLICAKATLCLRCYISESILKACKKIDFNFGGDKQFTYRDLLPFVLNDDAQKLVLFDGSSRRQFALEDQDRVNEISHSIFSISVLQTFKANLESRMSLDNWTYLQVRQNRELKKHLSEFGFKNLSDWAILNRARKKQLERLLVTELHVVEAFHAVYRRDRQQQINRGSRKCPDPTHAQLREMLSYLQHHQVWINTPVQLMRELKQIASQLRNYDIWTSREPLDIYDGQTGRYVPRRDLPTSSLNEVDIEQQEFLEDLNKCLYSTLDQVIGEQIAASIQKLHHSRKYAPFVERYTEGLHLYYVEAISLKDIAPKLGMTSWDQARRVLHPGELLSKVRSQTINIMLKNILEKAKDKGLTEIPPKIEYLDALTEQVESYVDEEIFQEAAEEIRAGKNRVMNSNYAQYLRSHISHSHI